MKNEGEGTFQFDSNFALGLLPRMLFVSTELTDRKLFATGGTGGKVSNEFFFSFTIFSFSDFTRKTRNNENEIYERVREGICWS